MTNKQSGEVDTIRLTVLQTSSRVIEIHSINDDGYVWINAITFQNHFSGLEYSDPFYKSNKIGTTRKAESNYFSDKPALKISKPG